jgi:hypothetical protein
MSVTRLPFAITFTTDELTVLRAILEAVDADEDFSESLVVGEGALDDPSVSTEVPSMLAKIEVAWPVKEKVGTP